MGDTSTTGVETETTDTGDTGNDTVLTNDQTTTDNQNSSGTNSDAGDSSSADDNATLDADGNPIADGDADAGADGSDTPPDTYADFTMPEGIEVDAALLETATPLFKELGLTQEQAQKLVDFQASQVQAGSQKQIDDFNQLKSDWREKSQNDSEFGGDKFDENVKTAMNAVNKYGTPEFKQLLEDYGVGNHPEVIRFMVRVGQTLGEDVPGSEGAATSKATDRAERMYPKDT